MLLRRIKNLWKLSAYRLADSRDKSSTFINPLVKDIPTIKHKLATIIPEEKQNILLEEIDERETS